MRSVSLPGHPFHKFGENQDNAVIFFIELYLFYLENQTLFCD